MPTFVEGKAVGELILRVCACVCVHRCLSKSRNRCARMYIIRVKFRENIWTVLIELLRVCVTLDWQTFTVKAQIVCILGFPAHVV